MTRLPKLQKMRGRWRIEPKRDFGAGRGYFIDGQYVKSGFIAVNSWCNPMPGALWFRTIPEAMRAIRIYHECAEQGLTSDDFWTIWLSAAHVQRIEQQRLDKEGAA